ncbi:cytochrome C' [Denitratisoma sp. DHT3]|uniref:c-type cytochrome n=1 Tax=Denitratisoma sp. DHT3 TaxID=1981880 RepID=UPI00119876F6|nr:c-type cytochrome [Denitratisoma sp. DHT3]QDX81894.1 cytochrome C' [Denitratisoma sp. DHT3]
MKSVIVALIAASGLIATGAAHADQKLASSKGCMACHSVDKKMVGPAFKEVAKKYTAKDTDALVKKVLDGGSGVWGSTPMPANKAMGVKPEDAKTLVTWVLSLK